MPTNSTANDARSALPAGRPGYDPCVEELQPSPGGNVLAGISNDVVRLLKEFYGKGPTRARTTYDGDLVVVLMRGGFTRVEQTLLDAGRGDSVIQQRMDFQEVMRERFNGVIERHTGREVIASMSGSHQDPDMVAELFVLRPEAELLADAQAGDDEASLVP